MFPLHFGRPRIGSMANPMVRVRATLHTRHFLFKANSLILNRTRHLTLTLYRRSLSFTGYGYSLLWFLLFMKKYCLFILMQVDTTLRIVDLHIEVEKE